MSAEDIKRRIEAHSRPDIHTEKDLPHWGGPAHFRKISAEMRFAVLGLQDEHKGKSLPAAVAIAATLCDENGDLVFPDLAEGIKAINGMKAEVHDELAGPALRVSGLGARSLEDAEKKS